MQKKKNYIFNFTAISSLRSYYLKCPAIFLIAGVFLSCKQPTLKQADLSMARLQLLSTDSAFSAKSENTGMKQAYLDFMDAEGALLRPGTTPLLGANAVDFLSQQKDSDYTLTWQPQHAEVAVAADFGYTFGIYSLRPHSIDTTLYGTYVSIWKKQADSTWKFVMNAENEGIGTGTNDK